MSRNELALCVQRISDFLYVSQRNPHKLNIYQRTMPSPLPPADPLAPPADVAPSNDSDVLSNHIDGSGNGISSGRFPVDAPVNAPPTAHHVQDVAMSLVSLGRTSPDEGETGAGTVPDLPPLPPNDAITETDIDSSFAPNKKPNTGTKYSMKPRDPKRDTSIPFEEMQRLMRVYGPIKCLRNRTPKESGKDLKQDSIKRKFYRWFPDFDNRFERTPEGWYKPKYGHEEEMLYRADMRKQDQDELVKKRNTKRTARKAKEAVVENV